ncbi:lactate dehydrogenase [Synechococcus sp. CCY 0621]|uniref:lactate dehydrogenase n=1 Tax=Synechococcus sp. CCY 0621 TaxID=2815603 RepID=UPI0025711E78|nr:lactate dehydrogenase [Synechococcus sp. CCY 0621]
MANEQQPREPWRRSPSLLAFGLAGGLVLSLIGGTGQSLANVQFENCVTAADGSITCDTVPTGNTLMNDVDARYGLLQNASPGWSEFEPYQGYDDDFGGNET